MTLGHLLVVDDDKRLLELLKQYLSKSDFWVTTAENTSEADSLLHLFTFDAIIMDVMMPETNGVEYTQSLRQKGIKTPILMLTAMGDVNSRITGLESGADDYLSKPFDPKELLLRIKNLLKHREITNDIFEFGEFTYTKSTGQLMKHSVPVCLTGSEQQLLKVLIINVNGVVTREYLAQMMQTDLVRTVDVQIARLRRKIEPDPKHPVWIQSVRGQGYKLVR